MTITHRPGGVVVSAVLLVLAATMGPVATAWAEPSPFVVVKPQASGPSGSPVEIVGFGFGDGQRVEIRWDGLDGQLLGDAVGRDFTAPVIIPDAAAGLHTLVVLSRDADGVLGSAATAGFLIEHHNGAAADDEAAQTPDQANPATSVPATSGRLWAAVVGLLVVLGAAVAWARWRRRSEAAPAPDLP